MFIILATLIWGFVVISQPTSKKTNPKEVAAPTSLTLPTETETPTSEPAAEVQLKTATEFTQEDAAYKDVEPQVFRGIDGSHTGGLVVNSQPDAANIFIESVGLESGREFSLSATAPFKAEGVPIGEYRISATANGYTSIKKIFFVTEDQILRLHIRMATFSPNQ